MSPTYPIPLPEVPVIERQGPLTLEDIRDDLAQLREVVGSLVALGHHILERLTEQETAIGDVNLMTKQTYAIVSSVRAEQVTLASVLEHAKLLREIHEREVQVRAERAVVDPDVSDTERPGEQ
jgi:phosphopentomutase